MTKQYDLNIDESQPARNQGGWIKAWRKLDTNTTLQEADTRGVFLTLLLRATTKPIKVFVRRINRHISLEEGQCYASIRDLTKLKLSAKRVRTILKNLENGHIISTTKGQGITVVTILNFKYYQARKTAGGTAKGTPTGTEGAHQGHTEQEVEEGEDNVRESLTVRQPPSSPKKSAPNAGARNGKMRAHELPEEWMPDERLLEWAFDKSYGFDIAGETEEFKTQAKATGRRLIDWRAGWRMWMMKADKWNAGRSGQRNYQQEGIDRAKRAVARMTQEDEE